MEQPQTNPSVNSGTPVWGLHGDLNIPCSSTAPVQKTLNAQWSHYMKKQLVLASLRAACADLSDPDLLLDDFLSHKCMLFPPRAFFAFCIFFRLTGTMTHEHIVKSYSLDWSISTSKTKSIKDIDESQVCHFDPLVSATTSCCWCHLSWGGGSTIHLWVDVNTPIAPPTSYWSKRERSCF